MEKKSTPMAARREQLSPQQEEFCRQFVMDYAAQKAARRAGYTNDKIGTNLIRIPKVKERIAELQKALRASQKELTEVVLKQYEQIALFKVSDIANYDGEQVTYKPMVEWNLGAETSVIGIKTDNMSQILEVKTADKMRALEALAKHLGLFCDMNSAIMTLRKYGLDLEKNTDGEWVLNNVVGESEPDHGRARELAKEIESNNLAKPISDPF